MNTIKKYRFYILGVVLVELVATVYYFNLPISPNPSTYKVQRTCDFVSVGDVTGAFCSDGTSWMISPFQQVAGK